MMSHCTEQGPVITKLSAVISISRYAFWMHDSPATFTTSSLCLSESSSVCSQRKGLKTSGVPELLQAVNQCIGRVIRHKGDWAAIILADARWTATGGSNPRQKLPAWIQDSLQVTTGFGDAYSKLTRFCKLMSQQA